MHAKHLSDRQRYQDHGISPASVVPLCNKNNSLTLEQEIIDSSLQLISYAQNMETLWRNEQAFSMSS